MILILNGSPRPNGLTAQMILALRIGAEKAGQEVRQFDVCRMNVHGCIACEYCHTRGGGRCVQKDDMQEIYPHLRQAETLVLASPIYYHNLSGQLKCVIDRFYAALFPEKPEPLRRAVMLLASGDTDVYDGALFSLEGDFAGYLELETKYFTAHGGAVPEETLREIREYGKTL